MDERLGPVIEEANENRAQFEAFCRGLSREQLDAPIPESHWRVQDYIAHLASIDTFVSDWFEHQADGRRWRPSGDDGGPFDIDVWNDARIDERRDASVDDLLGEAAQHRARLWAAVERFSPAVLDEPFNFRGRDISLLRYCQLWTAHDPAHSADMLRAIPDARVPSVDAWLLKYSM